MVLYWLWLIGLAAVGWFFALRQRYYQAARLYSCSAMLLSMLISWQGIGTQVYDWLETAVPQAGTPIHSLTVTVAVLALCTLWIVHPLALVAHFSFLGEQTPKRSEGD